LKFLLQTHDNFTNRGPICQLETSSDPITQEYVLKKYGSGYFCVKDNSPKMHTIWKGWIGEPRQRDEAGKSQSKDIQSLKRNTHYLALGEALLGAGEVIGFGLTASNFVSHGQRLNRVESIASAINARSPLGFVCPECLQPLQDLLGSFCGDCGATIDWTQRGPTREPTGKLCPHCSYPAGLAQRFCTQCGKALSIPSSANSSLRLIPVHSWSLP